MTETDGTHEVDPLAYLRERMGRKPDETREVMLDEMADKYAKSAFDDEVFVRETIDRALHDGGWLATASTKICRMLDAMEEMSARTRLPPTMEPQGCHRCQRELPVYQVVGAGDESVVVCLSCLSTCARSTAMDLEDVADAADEDGEVEAEAGAG